MKSFLCLLLWLGLAIPVLDGSSYLVLPTDAARVAHFQKYLAACGPDEVRSVWFQDNDIGAGMEMTLNLQDGSVGTLRDVFDFSEGEQEIQRGRLSPENIATVRKILAAMPPTQDVFPMAACVSVACQLDGKVKIFQYNLVTLPAPVLRLYKLGGVNLGSGEPDLRDAVTLTRDQADQSGAQPRPWTLPTVLAWYEQAKGADARKFWAHVLAVSRDPRAALALEKNLGQGDQSADLRDFCEFFSNTDGNPGKQTLADARQWLAANHATLATEAAYLSGQTPPPPPATRPAVPASPPAPAKN